MQKLGCLSQSFTNLGASGTSVHKSDALLSSRNLKIGSVENQAVGTAGVCTMLIAVFYSKVTDIEIVVFALRGLETCQETDAV
jgi:hypothetical protein